MPYSKQQRDAVIGSWENAKCKWDQEGSALFMDLFNESKGSFIKFGSLFGSMSQQAVKGSDQLSAQSQSFAKQMDMWISNLSSHDVCCIQSRRFAKLHRDRGVTLQELQCAMNLLCQRMKNNFDADLGAWQAVTGEIMNQIARSY